MSLFRQFGATALVAAYLLTTIAPPALAQPSNSEIADGILDAMIHARTLPDAFGGAWIADDRAVFAFTARATDEQVADVLGRVKKGIPVTTVQVDWSEAELDATADAITDAMVALGDRAFVNGVGTDLKRNAVVVSMFPEYFEVCQAGLLARFGLVRLVFESSPGDTGAQGEPGAPASPAASGSPEPLPEGCLPPPSPLPSILVSPLPSPAASQPAAG